MLSLGDMAYGELEEMGQASQPSLLYWNEETQVTVTGALCFFCLQIWSFICTSFPRNAN